MILFNDDYPYKIKLLGYSVIGAMNGTTKTYLYLKSHENIYTLFHESDVFSNTLTLKKGYDINTIKSSYMLGEFDEFLEFKKIKPNEILYDETISKSSQIMLIMKFSDSDSILLSKSIAIDLENNKLLVLSEKASPIIPSELLSKLHTERIK